MKRFLFIVLILGLVLFGCNPDNGNGGDDFVTSTNDSVSNDVATLGLVGITVSSSNNNVATAVIDSGKIKITSVSQGSATITVSVSGNNATIAVTVSKTGSISIGTITKYSEQGGNEQTIVGFWFAGDDDMYIKFELKADGTGIFKQMAQTLETGDEYVEVTAIITEYRVENGRLIFEYEGITDPTIFDYELSVDGNTLTTNGLMWYFEGENKINIEIPFTRRDSL